MPFSNSIPLYYSFENLKNRSDFLPLVRDSKFAVGFFLFPIKKGDMKVIQNLKSLFPQSFSEMAEEFYYFFLLLTFLPKTNVA